ncbi:hypothetical protein BC941DRAFT_422115 [Chlamydoabsidia padenii]|nr:hypothetical protein BC941DRAFT_422115 [Chlamydoabsidia padenii]
MVLATTATTPRSTDIPSTTTSDTNEKPNTCSFLRRRHCETTTQSAPEHDKKQQVTSNPFNDLSYTNKGFYDCNICFDTAIYPVLTVCGHLFCWVCLSRWLDQQTINPTCPMCKAGCPQDKIIPVYGRGREEVDPRCDASIPSRPSGQRPEPLHNPNIAGSSFFHPFRNQTVEGNGNSIFLSSNSRPSNQANQSNGFLSRLMLMILSLFIVVIVFY